MTKKLSRLMSVMVAGIAENTLKKIEQSQMLLT